MVDIFKASAGSGKTYTLARQYLMLSLKKGGEYLYRSILGVTFTNKSTEEMKSRILVEMSNLASQNSKYFKDPVFLNFMKENGYTQQSLSVRAREVLINLLNDYSAFSISTIDAFFQRVIRSFSMELGRGPSYQVELGRKELINEAADSVLSALTADKSDEPIVEWIKDSSINTTDGKLRTNFTKDIYEMAAGVLSHECVLLLKENGFQASEVFSLDNLERIKKSCRGIVASRRKNWEYAREEVRKQMDACGLSPEDTLRGFLNPDNFKFDRLSKTISDSCDNPSKWFKKDNMHLVSKVSCELVDAVKGYAALFKDLPVKEYNTALSVLNSLPGLVIASRLRDEFNKICLERNVMTLDDSTTLLSELIDDSDTPFVYEKLGVRYDHFLLDEFQDTSRPQWENMLPLLRESVSKGGSSLIVGDVKQSIYRWRNSDSDLLKDGIQQEFSDALNHSLDTNRRSHKNIVEFNNGFFKHVANMLGKEDSYSDVEQKFCDSSYDGYLQFDFVDEDENQLDKIVEAIKSGLEAGYSYGEMAVLTRLNKDGSKVALHLLHSGIPVVSEESLKIKSSPLVNLLVSALSSLACPQDKIASYLFDSFENLEMPETSGSIFDLCEAILRNIRTCDEKLFNGQIVYIQAFEDVVKDWCGRYGNNLPAFLNYWKDQDPSIVSTKADNAVRILTIHKSKGLEFPYLIFPFVESIKMEPSKFATLWCRPDDADATEAIRNMSSGSVFSMKVTASMQNTFFRTAYEKECDCIKSDALNLLYVAMTRPEICLHVIASADAKKDNCANYLKAYLEERFGESKSTYSIGTLEHSQKEAEKGEIVTPLSHDFPSFPIADRLKIKEDGTDFFNPEGRSARVKGIVLHGILSKVKVYDDLEPAVNQAVELGLLPDGDRQMVVDMLSSRLNDVTPLHWFSDKAEIVNELSLMSSDGQVFRPDRVVSVNGKLMVIDFKFGEYDSRYERQVRRYMSLYRAMGYENVEGYIWYLMQPEEDSVVCVSEA